MRYAKRTRRVGVRRGVYILVKENVFKLGNCTISVDGHFFSCMCGLALVLALASAGFAQQAAPAPQGAAKIVAQPAAASGYVGSDTCKTCHEDIYTKGFERTPHYNLIKEGKHGCEDCHGPGQAHVEGGGDPSKIFAFKGVAPAQISSRCLSCHQLSQEHGNWTRSVHAANGVTCINCHSPHAAKVERALLIQSTPQLCYGCHSEQKAEFSKPFRHRVNEGLIQCQDCHNPHGTVRRRGLRAVASEQEVCLKCHRDKQGPFLFEHPPVRLDGCTSCHTPHGSVNARLLRVTPVNVLCMQCHTPAMNAAAPGIPNFHNQTQKYQACTMCHPSIHGSNAVETFEY